MQKPVEQGGCDDGITKNITPFCKAAIGRQDHCSSLVAGVDELEEQIAAAGDDREIADLIDDQQTWPAEEADALLQPALAFGPGQRCNEIGQRAEVDALASFDGFDAERHGEMAFAGSRRPEKMHRFMPVDETQLRKREDPISIEGGLEGEIEAGECFDGCQATHSQCRFYAAVLAQGQFFVRVSESTGQGFQ